MQAQWVRSTSPVAEGLPSWCDELAYFLGPDHFPARLDQVVATLARRGAPSGLQWRLASLPLSATFDGRDELIVAALHPEGLPPAVGEPL